MLNEPNYETHQEQTLPTHCRFFHYKYFFEIRLPPSNYTPPRPIIQHHVIFFLVCIHSIQSRKFKKSGALFGRITVLYTHTVSVRVSSSPSRPVLRLRYVPSVVFDLEMLVPLQVLVGRVQLTTRVVGVDFVPLVHCMQEMLHRVVGTSTRTNQLHRYSAEVFKRKPCNNKISRNP